MIKTNISRWYDVQCDAPDCNHMISAEYQQCIGWALPTQAVNAAMEAGWERREEDGIEHMYCSEHKTDAAHVSWLAKCCVCGKEELSETAPAFAYARDYFEKRGWKIERGTDNNQKVITCPDCAKKGQAK